MVNGKSRKRQADEAAAKAEREAAQYEAVGAEGAAKTHSCCGMLKSVVQHHSVLTMCYDHRETYNSYSHVERLFVLLQAVSLDFLAALIAYALETKRDCVKTCAAMVGVDRDQCKASCAALELSENASMNSMLQSALIATVLSVLGGKFFVGRVFRRTSIEEAPVDAGDDAAAVAADVPCRSPR